MGIDRWFPVKREDPASKLRLFCLPPAGGSARQFRPWLSALPSGIDVFAFQLPGRAERWSEPPFTSMQEVVDALVASTTNLRSKPFALYGHSMGGLIAYEFARRLRRMGTADPTHLLVSGARAPHYRDTEMYHLLGDDELIEALGKLDGFPQSIIQHREMIELLLPTMRADAKITETYCYVCEPPLSCDISVFIGSEDKLVSITESEAWKRHTAGRASVVVCPGNHDLLSTPPPALIQGVHEALVHSRWEARPIGDSV